MEPDRPQRNGAAATGSPEPPPARPQRRIHHAENDVRTWVKEARGLDVGSGATFDGRLDSVGVEWHKQDNEEHGAYLSALGERLAESRQLIMDSQVAVQQTEADRKLAWQDYVTTRLRLGGKLPPGTAGETDENLAASTNYQEPNLLPGQSRLEPLMWLFVIGAVSGDIAAFYGVLAQLFRTEPFFVATLAVGFAAAAIGICHFIGVGLQRKRSRERRRSDGLLWAKVAAWLGLGCAAFLARLQVGTGTTPIVGGTSFGATAPTKGLDQALLAALTFGGLYLVSGLLAITASFHAFNPAAKAYRRALRNLKETAQRVRNAQAEQTGRIEREKVLTEEQQRATERLTAAYRHTEADVTSLKIFARHRIAAAIGNPKALVLLMRDAPKVDKYPEPGHVS